MRKITGLFLMACFALSFAPKKENKELVVLELFTSEGCSSCPSADKLLKETIDHSAGDKEIFALAFHVDYWDYLGWKDKFADPAYTNRQRSYGKHFSAEGVYTPQMVANGTTEFVGSDRNALKAALNKSIVPTAFVALTVKNKTATQITLQYKMSGGFRENLLNVALVENEISSMINAGENKGKTLVHAHTVLEFQTIAAMKEEGEVTINTQDLLTNKGKVIAFIQHKNKLNIIGASSIAL